uniref:Cyclic nucleotide-binding domain-containing protein n=1 Tax=Euplotes crassus TaxID=5936 RepID=A0A7S3KDF4_EUPCR|mmetsp:Transcript_17421/g.17149  ORF Transcript_17421/g.17149 Transcript_17421/m.17149 type:complete len:157 (+) Transcript_17421:203-673(+)
MVFEKGSIGDTFYIILHGDVGVYVPRQKKQAILKMETMSKSDRKSLRNSIASSKKFNSILPIHTMKKIENMAEFIVLKGGQAFGEAALINNAPRSASILCKTDCHFAIMNKENFNGTLLAIEQRRQQKFANFLKSLKMFNGWTNRKCERLLHAIEK